MLSRYHQVMLKCKDSILVLLKAVVEVLLALLNADLEQWELSWRWEKTRTVLGGKITVKCWSQYLKNYKGLEMAWEILSR